MATKSTPDDLSESLVSNVYASHIVTYIAAFIAVCLRFTARRLQKLTWWWDDWVVLVALVSAAGWFIAIIFRLHNGLAVHYQTVVGPEQSYDHYLRQNLILLFVTEIFYSTTAALVKISILLFYWRLFSRTSIRLPIYVVGGLIVAWLLARLLTIFLHCIPLRGFWDTNVDAHCGVNDREFFMGTNTLNVINDLMLFALPLPYIKKLQIKGSQKAIVFGIFLFGGLITVCSIITTIVCYQYDDESPDVGWNITWIEIWAGVEINLAIVCACLPSLRPIVLLFKKRVLGIESSQHSSNVYSHGSSSNRSLRKPSGLRFWNSSRSGVPFSGSHGSHGSHNEVEKPTSASRSNDDDLNAVEAGLGVPPQTHQAACFHDDKAAESVPTPPVNARTSADGAFEIQVQNEVDVDVERQPKEEYSPPMIPVA